MRLLFVQQVSSPPVGEFPEFLRPALFDLIHRSSSFYLFARTGASVNHIKWQLVVDIFVRRLLPLEAIGIESTNRADEGDAGDDRFEGATVDDVKLNAATYHTGELVKSRLKVKWAKRNAGQVGFLQLS